MRRLIISLMLVLFLTSVAFGARLTQKQLAFIDEFGDPVNLGTSVVGYIYDVGTTTTKTIWLDSVGNNEVTQTSGFQDDTTNTCIRDYTRGIISFWCKSADYKITITDGTYTRTLDNLTGSDTRMMWPTFLVALSSYNLGVSEDLDFTFGEWVVDGDIAGRLDFTPDSADGVLAFGASTGSLQGDIYTYASSTEFMYFDQSGAELNFTHIDVIVDDDSTLYFGDGKDIAFKFDNGNDDFDITGDGSELAIGATGAGLDVVIWGQTGNYIIFDEDSDELQFIDIDVQIQDGADLEFYHTDTVDWKVECATGDRLAFIPTLTDDTAVFHIGSATNTADVVIYSITAGETFTWDAGVDSLTVVDNLTLFTVTGTTLPFHVNATGTVTGEAVKLETTDGGITLLADGAANGDILIDGEDKITIVSYDVQAEGIYIHENATSAATGSIYLHADKGAAATANAASIQLTSDDGGVQLVATTDTAVAEKASAIQLTTLAGGIELYSALDATNAIKVTVDGGTSSDIDIYNDTGNTADSIHILSDIGGISIVADDITTGDILIDANDTLTLLAAGLAADSIYIHANGGVSESIEIRSDQGTGDESVYLLSDVGGITLQAAAGSIDIEAVGGTGDMILNSGNDMTFTVAGDLTFGVTGAIVLPDDVLLRAVVDINEDEIDALASSPFEILASPAGTDLTYEFVSAILAMDYGGTAWTEPSDPDDLVFRYTDGSGAMVSTLIEATGFATATADTIVFVSPISDIPAGTTAAVPVLESASTDQSIVLDNTGTDWTGNGNGAIRVVIYYRIHTTTELGL